jgi:hypothetical protein
VIWKTSRRSLPWRRVLGVGLETLGLGSSLVRLPIRLRMASCTLARPFASMLSFRRLTASGAWLPFHDLSRSGLSRYLA